MLPFYGKPFMAYTLEKLSGLVEGVVAVYGPDVTIMSGGGVHGHPKGTLKGAMAHRAAADAVAERKSLPEKAKEVPELRTAIYKWGYVSREKTEKRLRKEKKRLTMKHALKGPEVLG